MIVSIVCRLVSLQVQYWMFIDQAGLLEDASPGGESPVLPSGRLNVSHQQLESMLSMHGLRDMANDD